MDTALQALLSYQFILLCLELCALTYIIRLLVQFFILDRPNMPGSRTSALWREVILPTTPFILGVLAGWLIKHSLYPEGVITTASRVQFGLVAGLLSGLVYRVIWGMIKAKLPDNNFSNKIESAVSADEINKISDQIANP